MTNISVTPNTSTEQFVGPDAVLAKDNLRIEFRAHLLWKIDPENVRTFVEKYGQAGWNPEEVAYNNFIKEPFRTYTRDEVQKYDGLDIKENIDAIGSAVQARILKLTRGTPFTIISVVIGNIQYPQTVADSVANKLAATQVLDQTTIEIQTAKAKAQIREADAEGVAKAMDTINQKLTPLYVQYEAIQAQQKMVNSPEPHGSIYSGRSDGRTRGGYNEARTRGQAIARAVPHPRGSFGLETVPHPGGGAKLRRAVPAAAFVAELEQLRMEDLGEDFQ